MRIHPHRTAGKARTSALLPVILLVLGILPARAAGEKTDQGEPPADGILEAYIWQEANGTYDWTHGWATAWGEVPPEIPTGRSKSPKEEREAAALKARTRLAENVREIAVDADTKLGDRKDLVGMADDAIANGRIADERMSRQGGKMVNWIVSFRGLQGLGAGSLRILQPGIKLPAAEQIGGRQAFKPKTPESPTMLVVDARGLGAHPVIFPRILDESGTEIASVSTADPAMLTDGGLASYAWELPIQAKARAPQAGREAKRSVLPLGARPLWVRASKVEGTLSGDLVLPAAEAAKVRATAGEEELIRACRIVILLDRPPSLLERTRAPARKTQPRPRKRLPLDKGEPPGQPLTGSGPSS